MTNKKRKLRKKLKQKIETENGFSNKGTFKNMVLGIANGKSLYKKLITAVHPDKFIGKKNEEATELSKRITKAKKDYQELLLIQSEVESFLKNQ